MINLHESMGPGRDRTRDPWICSQLRICSQTRYRLRYAAQYLGLFFRKFHQFNVPYLGKTSLSSPSTPPPHLIWYLGLCGSVWALSRENLSSVVCEQQRLRSACTSTQPDQRLCYLFFWKVSYLNLLPAKFKFSSYSL